MIQKLVMKEMSYNWIERPDGIDSTDSSSCCNNERIWETLVQTKK